MTRSRTLRRTTDGPRGSERLTFVDDGTAIRLVRRTRRGKPAFRGDDLERTPPSTRFWVEVVDEADAVLYRRTIPEPLRSDTEAFSPDGRITRVPLARSGRMFSVVVPVGHPATHVSVMAGGTAQLPRDGLAGEPRQRDGARELVRVWIGGS